MKIPTGTQLLQATSYTLLNLATPVGFYIAFHEKGAKAAIAFAIFIVFFQVLAHWFYRIRPSAIFIVASGFTVTFGLIDLILKSPRFFRLEPFAQNFLIATVFLGSFLARIPILNWFVESLPRQFRAKLVELPFEYFQKLTLVWCIYLYCKSVVFLFLAFRVDLARLIVLRTLLGGGTLLLMILGELLYRKYFFRSKQMRTSL